MVRNFLYRVDLNPAEILHLSSPGMKPTQNLVHTLNMVQDFSLFAGYQLFYDGVVVFSIVT